MAKYSNGDVVIDAFQMTKERRQDNSDWPEWLISTWGKGVEVDGSIYPINYPHSDGTDRLKINTPHGGVLVDWGDYIILDKHGKLRRRRPEIFKRIYTKCPKPSILERMVLNLPKKNSGINTFFRWYLGTVAVLSTLAVVAIGAMAAWRYFL